MSGYHKSKIKRGKLGELSKLQEELDEALDAERQGIKIMLLLELSDLYGALDLYLIRHFPNISMKDLKAMSRATHRAFASGERIESD